MRIRLVVGSLIALVAAAPSLGETPLGTAFTYQGQLKQSGVPFDGMADFQFTLWDAAGSGNPPIGGTQVDGAQAINALPVTAGLFTVTLNAGGEFGGNAFNGNARWLQIAMRSPAGGGDFTTLAPRQPLTATPHALFALNADRLDGLDSTAFLQSIPVPLTLSGTSATHIIRGENASTVAGVSGLLGSVTGASGISYGVFGQSASTAGRGVYGLASAATGTSVYGVIGQSVSTSGRGVFGFATATSGVNYGVFGNTQSPNGYAGYFTGAAGSLNYFQRNVGIGTTAPGNMLHVMKDSAGVVTGHADAPLVVENSTDAYINLLTPDANERGMLFGSPTAGATAGGIIYNAATTPDGLQFRTGGNVDRMVIDSTGNVGIGTGDPTALLHLKQNTNQYAIRMEAERFVLAPTSASDSTSTVTQIAGDGSAWLNPGSAGAIDGASASTVLTTPTGDAESDELDFRNFGFNLPGGAVIRNVRVTINGSHTGGCSTCIGLYARLDFFKHARLANGATFGTVHGLRGQTVGGTFLDSGNDLWGLPLTPAIVNSSSFGLRLRVRMIPVTTGNSGPPFYIDLGVDCPTSCTANTTAMINGITVRIEYDSFPTTPTHAEYTVGIGPGSTDFRISPSPDFSVVSFAVNQDGIVNIGPIGSGIMLNVFGGAAKNGGGSWSSISDARLKRDIAPLHGTLDRLLTLRGRSYEFNDNEVKSGRALPGRQIGLIAQEVEQVFPDWIDYTKDGYRMVTERATTALMVESLRDLRREKDEGLAAQQHQIDALRQENAELRKRLEALEGRRR